MAEFLLTSTTCADCGKDLPLFSLVETYGEDFVVCLECNEAEEAAWREMQEMLSSQEV